MPSKDKKTDKTSVTKVVQPKKKRNILLVPVYFVGGYLKGSWQELRQVRWPNRKATWGMTAAVIFFTGLFVALIVFLDWVFSTLFNLVIK
ncbi:MAG TPA: preprotein translocase subunit SecE [Candidatus Saccharimonadales bacterium]|nr:preprotein translocase subunit SecE [Candidatus Saccharimonadales bacterium]